MEICDEDVTLLSVNLTRSVNATCSGYAGAILTLCLSVCCPAARGQSPQPENIRILLPAYANPAGDAGKRLWDRLAELNRERRPGVVIDVIFNPASGPGIAREGNYLDDAGNGPLADVQSMRVLGYVPTTYGKRSTVDVKRDIDCYATGFYQGYVSGIFFDEMSSDLDHIAYYRELNEYAHQVITASSDRPVWTIGNPGVAGVQSAVTDERLRQYATSVDQLVVFESHVNQYQGVQTPPFARFLEPRNLAHMIHSQSSWSSELFGMMRQHRVGSIFITDDVMQNPYDQLPSYFDEMIDAVAELNENVLSPPTQ